MNPKRVTIEEVAEATGVSISTVSNFLNGKYGSMAESTRDRIAKVVEQLNYRPNMFAQGLKGSRSRTIGLVFLNIGYPYCVSLIRALNGVFARHDYRLVVCETKEDANQEAKILESLVAQQVEAIVIQATGKNLKLIADIAKSIPVVIVDREYSVDHTLVIATNNMESSEEVTRRLFESGYHRVLFVSEPVQSVSTRSQRLEGYVKACENAGKDTWIAWTRRDDPESLGECIRNIEESNSDYPIAVYTANGLIMIELYPRLRELNLSVPHQLGLATFDNPDWALLTTPALSTVSQPILEMGEFAANKIMEALQGHQHIMPQKRRVFPSTIQMNASTQLHQTS